MIKNETSHKNYPKTKAVNVDEKLLADVVHKIKNGLGGIGGFATLLERDLDADDPRKRLAARIQDGVHKVNDIVVNLMTLVRLPDPRFKKINLPVLLRNICKDQYDYEKREMPEISCEPDVTEDEFIIQADEEMVQKMVIHALQFTQAAGKKVHSIRVNSKQNLIELEFLFLCDLFFGKALESIDQFLDDVSPIGARLSLTIIIEIAYLHGGNVTINSYSDDQKILVIQLPKGK